MPRVRTEATENAAGDNEAPQPSPLGFNDEVKRAVTRQRDEAALTMGGFGLPTHLGSQTVQRTQESARGYSTFLLRFHQRFALRNDAYKVDS